MDEPATATAAPAPAPAPAPSASGFTPVAGPLDDRTAEQVLNWAMALTYAEDGPGLSYLRDRYGPAMNETPFGATFRLLTASDLGPIDSVADLGRIGTSIDLFSQFLDSYRTRLQEDLTEEAGAAVDPLAMDGGQAVTG